jgi:hypothetical protein
MITRHLLFLGGAALLFAPTAQAQDDSQIVLGAYFRCNQSLEARTDTIFAEVMKPVMQTQVDAGRITTFGWARHWMGGAWRRLSYMVGTDRDAVLDARAAYLQEIQANHADAAREFNAICSSHDDYIWRSVATSNPAGQLAQDRPGAGLTSYMVCDSREAEADEIVQTAFAPILDRHVADGHVNSWSWLQHRVGGWYRRALVLDAADYKSVLNYWDMLWEDLDEEQPELLREFSAICDSHADYVWDLSLNQ